MKKIYLNLFFILACCSLQAQFSFNDISESLSQQEKNEAVRIPERKIPSGTQLIAKDLMAKLMLQIDSITNNAKQKIFFVLKQDTILKKDAEIEEINRKADSVVAAKQKEIREIEHWEKFFLNNKITDRTFFPAYYSQHSIAFFEGDSTHQKLFENNLINYSPTTKKMILYTEAVNDYLGPLRVGIGFQVKSESKVDSLSTVDSTIKQEKKDDVLSDLRNGGGDISLNFKFPLLKSKNPKTLIRAKFYLYGNTAFSLPILNKANNDFLFNYNFGIEGTLYARGFNNKLTFFTLVKSAFFAGNKNFKKIIQDFDKNDPTSFLMFQSSFGIDFMDGYRFRVDLFNGNSFIKKNFPATVTFIVRPGKGNANKNSNQ